MRPATLPNKRPYRDYVPGDCYQVPAEGPSIIEKFMLDRTGLLVLTLCSLLSLAAVGADKGERKPGERDYPVLNPSPADKIPISGTLPEGWTLRLTVQYDAGKHDSHLILPGPDCEYDASGGIAGAMFPYHVTIDLPVSQKGSEFNAELPFDHFQPGRCEWHASILFYRVTTKNGEVPRRPPKFPHLWPGQTPPPSM
jgi:hypothetical protein